MRLLPRDRTALEVTGPGAENIPGCVHLTPKGGRGLKVVRNPLTH